MLILSSTPFLKSFKMKIRSTDFYQYYSLLCMLFDLSSDSYLIHIYLYRDISSVRISPSHHIKVIQSFYLIFILDSILSIVRDYSV